MLAELARQHQLYQWLTEPWARRKRIGAWTPKKERNRNGRRYYRGGHYF